METAKAEQKSLDINCFLKIAVLTAGSPSERDEREDLTKSVNQLSNALSVRRSSVQKRAASSSAAL